LSEGFRGEGVAQGLRPQGGQDTRWIVRQPQLAELPAVHESHLAPVIKLEGVADHGVGGLGIGLDEEAAGHTQVDYQGLVVLVIALEQGHQDVLSTASYVLDLLAVEPKHKIFHADALNGLGPTYLGASESPPRQTGL
jgi:hypothetical protein